MQNPANKANSGKSPLTWQNALPPVIWALPATLAGISFSLFRLPVPFTPDSSFGLLLALYLFYLGCIYQIYKTLLTDTEGKYPVKPAVAVLLNIVGGPAAALIASTACDYFLKGLNSACDLVSEVLPSSLPVMNSAVGLVERHGLYLAIALACATAVICQVKLAVKLRGFIESRSQTMVVEKHRSLMAAGLLGVALATPGILLLLGTSASAWQITGDAQWTQRSQLLSYLSATLVFLILAMVNKRIAQALEKAPAENS